jgi:hypothetical protein
MSNLGWLALIAVCAAVFIWFVVGTWRYYRGIWRRTSAEYRRQAQQRKREP